MAHALLGLAALLAAGGAAAQQAPAERCDLVFDNTPNTRLTYNRLPSGSENLFIGGGVLGRCRGQEITLRSDSAEYYGASRMLLLVGGVRYEEPRATLTSSRLNYFLADERVIAEGSVVVTLPSGTTMRGPYAEYLRPVPAIRTASRLTAPQRTVTRLVQRDSAGGPQEPVLVEADRTVSIADSVVYLGGRVEIDRSDVETRSDSAWLDGPRDRGQLINRAVVRGKGERPFVLESRLMDLYTREKQLQRLVAQDSARARSEDLDLRSDTIAIVLDSSRIERAEAWGRSRARAVSPERTMLADSLDIRMPGQVLQEVRAIGSAYVESDPDSTRLRAEERDWLRGDSIFARFEPPPPGDTASRARPREIEAIGEAASYYQIPSSRGPTAPPAINYVRGSTILVDFDSAEVQRVTVRDQATGVYLEPGEGPAAAGRRGGAAGAKGERPGAPASTAAPVGGKSPGRQQPAPTPSSPGGRPPKRPAPRPPQSSP